MPQAAEWSRRPTRSPGTSRRISGSRSHACTGFSPPGELEPAPRDSPHPSTKACGMVSLRSCACLDGAARGTGSPVPRATPSFVSSGRASARSRGRASQCGSAPRCSLAARRLLRLRLDGLAARGRRRCRLLLLLLRWHWLNLPTLLVECPCNQARGPLKSVLAQVGLEAGLQKVAARGRLEPVFDQGGSWQRKLISR